MKYPASYACYEDQLYLAGQVVPPGTYQRISDNRIITLERCDYLPATLDGKVACYIKVTLPANGDAVRADYSRPCF